MSLSSEKCIDFYCGEYKRGIFSKKSTIYLGIYPSQLEVTGFTFYDNELSNDIHSFEISYDDISKIYIGEIGKETAMLIEYNAKSVVTNSKSTVALFGIADMEKWIALIEETKSIFVDEKAKNQEKENERKKEQQRLAIEKEEKASRFYQDCYSYHIKETTPTYQLFSDKNKVALIYIGADKSLNFLKIDGYSQEENIGVITYENIHYYEKAGNVSYITDIHGNYSSFGGSMTGGKFSKLATVGGGLLFGFMGMALGAALTYKASEQKPINTSFSIDSDIRKIDDRSVMLNFYSDIKKQYIDIELPQDIYNFLQTYLPEKKYGIVDELEKQTVVHQSLDLIANGSLLKVSVDTPSNVKETQQIDSTDDFKLKVERLKIMKEAGLLSDEKFEAEQKKLLNMI